MHWIPISPFDRDAVISLEEMPRMTGDRAAVQALAQVLAGGGGVRVT
jgi:hypothetical protein